MIVSASYRTDIPAFYGRWFLNRLRDGYCRVVNPYGGAAATVSLAPADVDGFVFWTRNAGPFLGALHEVAARGFPFVVQFTITGYPRALDAATIATTDAAAQIEAIARAFGPRAVVWRYDPIVFSSLTPPQTHHESFSHIAKLLKNAVDEVVLSVAHVYRKTKRNTDAAADRAGFAWRDPPDDEKRALLADLAAIAAGHGLKASLCGQRALLVPGLADAACVDANRLSDIAGRQLAVPRKAHRAACGCWASRDIGDYDTCPHGCAYCYAVRDRAAAKTRFRAHDPDSPFLIPPRTGV